MMLTEGDLQIDFPDAVYGRKFDGPDHGLSHCMKAVDCNVFNLDSWNRTFPHHPAGRRR